MEDPCTQAKSGYTLRDQLGFKVSQTARLMQHRFEADLASHGLTRLSWCVLSSIGLEGITSPSDVARNLGITRPALSRLIKSMARDGVVQIALTDGDGRNRSLSLTTKGQQKLNDCLPLAQANNAHFLSKLPPDQMVLLHTLLDRLIEGEVTEFERF